MLQTISKHIQGWIAGVVIALVAAAFVLWGLEYYITSSRGQQNTVATVNGVKITQQGLNRAYEMLQRNFTQQEGATLDPQTQHQLQNMALQQLILDQVMLQTVDKMGFTISIKEVQQEVLRIPAFQENGQFSPQKFQQLLNNNGISPDQFLVSVQASLLVNQLSSGLRNSEFATTNELAQVYGVTQQQRSFGYFILPGARFSASVRPTEEQIKSYYQQHLDQFRTPEQVKVAYILLSPDNLKSQIKISDEQIQQYYQDNTSQFGGKPLAEVKSNIEQRLYGQQISQVLATKSGQLEDLTYTNPSSLQEAAKAIEVPIQTTNWMPLTGMKGDPIFSDPKVISALSSDEVLKQNNNSQLIELKNGGFIVLRVAERQPSQNQPLEAVHDQIKQSLQKEQGQKQAGLQAYEIQRALSSGATPADVAKKYNVTWIEKNNIAMEDKTLPPALLKAIFTLPPSVDPAKKAVTSSLLSNGDYAIIQLQSIQNGNLSQASVDMQQRLRNGLANRMGDLDYQLFAKSALDKAKVKNLLK